MGVYPKNSVSIFYFRGGIHNEKDLIRSVRDDAFVCCVGDADQRRGDAGSPR